MPRDAGYVHIETEDSRKEKRSKNFINFTPCRFPKDLEFSDAYFCTMKCKFRNAYIIL